jgi:23S rRNA (guanine2445-N2)-methyltransferase / 23S rRNA (guanine2069-N7)-methyltransferase
MSAPTFFVTAATGTADLLAAELVALGIADAREVLGGVNCASPLPGAYRACLWSRVGLRVLWRIAEFPVADADEMYGRLREIDWSTHMDVGDTLAVDFSGKRPGISTRSSARSASRMRSWTNSATQPGSGRRSTGRHRRCGSTCTRRAGPSSSRSTCRATACTVVAIAAGRGPRR